uniref:Uncharacterized protein n=1 Tax=Plectus sambesii TaxID=2011161 RepID=A0A914XG58_9BILA
MAAVAASSSNSKANEQLEPMLAIMREVAEIFDPLGTSDSRGAQRAQFQKKKATLKADLKKLSQRQADISRQTATVSAEVTKEEERKAQLLKECDKIVQDMAKVEEKHKNCVQEIADIDRNIDATKENLGNVRAELLRSVEQRHSAERKRMQSQVLTAVTGLQFVPEDKAQTESTARDSLDSMEVDEEKPVVEAFALSPSGQSAEIVEFAKSDPISDVSDRIWDVIARTNANT